MLKKLVGFAVACGAWMLVSPAYASPQHDGYGYGGGGELRCESRDSRFTRCDVNWREAYLVRRLSESRCIEGQTWGIDRRGLWVDRGCAGIFARGRGGYDDGYGGGWRPGPNWDTDITLSCRSEDYRYRFCSVDIGRGGGVRIVRQLSETACIEGRTWGANRAGIWVSGGCAGVFEVQRRWR